MRETQEMLDLILPWFGGLIIFLFIGYAMYKTMRNQDMKGKISVHQNASKNWHRKALLTLFNDLKNGTLDIMQTR